MAERNLAILVSARNLSKRVFGEVRGDIKGIEGAASRAGRNLGRNLAIGGGLAAAGLAVQVRAGVDSLVELERVENLTAAALKSTGNAAQQSADGIRARSEALEHMTGVDDKVLQNAQNLLLTFPEIGKDAFEPTLEAAVNLNAALGGGDESLQGVLLQVAKAVNDPIRGMTALRRSGVSFTEAQQKQVRELVEANDLMGAQAIVLGELETQFGGAAEAANQGALRAQRRWTDGVEDIQKSLATGFLPLIERVSTKMSELVADPEFLAGVESFGQTLASGFDEALDFAEGVDWGAIGSALQTAGSGARMAMDAFLSAPPWLQTAILTGWGLNKLTGGAVGSLVGELGKGLIKGVLGMNAGVVNINAATVNGPGGGLPGAAGRGGGFLGGLGRGLATGAAVGGGVALMGVAVNEAVQFDAQRDQWAADLATQISQLPRATGTEINQSIDRITAVINEERPLLDGILFNTNVKPVLDAELATLRELQRSEATRASQFMAVQQQQRDAIHRANSEEGRRFTHLTSVQQAAARDAASFDRALLQTAATEVGIQRGILAKRSTVNVTANLTNVVSLSTGQVLQRVNSLRQSLNAGGFI